MGYSVCRPLLPLADKLRPYLERIDAARYYSNMGPLIVEFEQRLAVHFGASASEIVTSANGTLALTQMLKALDVRPGSLCVMPSWTFSATPAAAISAGMKPCFVDIKKQNWAIHPEDVLPLLAHDVGAVIVVAPFGAPVDTAEWERFQNTTGIAVIIDAAAGFDSFGTNYRKARTSLPFMVSLHATKVLGIGEGAVVVTKGDELAERIRMEGNFGFYGSRESQMPAMNAKLSEYAAAVGLAALDEWEEKRAAWQLLSNEFEKRVKALNGITCMPHFNQGWISCYGLVELPSHLNAETVKKQLADCAIQTISWWGKGCHAQAAYKHYPRGELMNTAYLGDHILGLPFWIGLTDNDFSRISERLAEIVDSASLFQKMEVA